MGCHCTKIWLTCDIYCYSAADQSLVIVTVKRRNRYVVKEASRKRVVLRLGIHVSLVLSDGFQFSHTQRVVLVQVCEFSLVIHSVLFQYRFVSLVQSYIACCFSVGLCFQFSHACSQFILIHFSYGFLILKFFKVSLPKLTLYPPLLWYPQVSHAASSCHTPYSQAFHGNMHISTALQPICVDVGWTVSFVRQSCLLVHASVNSLTAVIGPWAVRPACTAFMLFRLLNLKLCELIIACGTLSHNTLSACTSRLCT